MSTKSESSEVVTAVAGENSSGISRRKFLQIIGSASAAGAVGCTDRAAQNIFPLGNGDPEQIPGVAVWYSSTCTECSAGCGIQVRTREGRAVKVEGNPDSPINRGGLCALGQSSLQSLYDPDRIRQPLKRTLDDKGVGILQPIGWDAAYSEVATAIKGADKKKVLLTGEVSGSLAALIKEFCSDNGFEHVSYDVTAQGAVAKAAGLVFGVEGIPTYRFENTDVILNFGADFLETWISPCEYARGWAKARHAEKPVRFVHIEPRLSLTGANADHWLSAKPGTELRIALALLKGLVGSGKGKELSSDTLQGIRSITASSSYDEAAKASGVPLEKILLVAEYLKNAEHPLVIAGGNAASNETALALGVVANLINLALGAVGDTVDLSKVRAVTSSPSKMASLAESINKGEVSVLLVHGTNPAFSFPTSFGFGPEGLKKVRTIASFSSHLDETTELADLLLPAHTGLESWGDARVYAGVYSLAQPVMTPVFDTKSFGDSLLTLSTALGKAIGGKAATLHDFIKSEWKKLHGVVGGGTEFKQFWLAAVERGGFFSDRGNDKKPTVSSAAFALDFGGGKGQKGLVLYPYFSVKSFDGRAANRPWLQELPDPMTSIVWDSWAEIHPDTAHARGIKQGDFVTVRNFFGEINVPAFLTSHVSPNVIAVPVGQGHRSYGRYAKKVSGGNVLELIANRGAKELGDLGDIVPLMTAEIEARRGVGPSQMVLTQGSDMQGKREIAKISFFEDSATSHGHEDAHLPEAEGHGAGHHEPKQMYEQREHPLYHWGMAVDLSTCTGCGACVVACYAENNIPVVGKKLMSQGREMSWLRIERYMDGVESEELQVSFLPMMCQQCENAPCEPVCPVYATYHNDEGLNVMVYNRCVGTRYCSNNCSYKVRRFNWFDIDVPEPLSWQLNPDITKRTTGIMEKCTFCVQRISEAKDHAKDEGRQVRDGEIKPACAQSCPTEAIVFGNLNDPNSRVSKLSKQIRSYKVLDHHINTQPAISYSERMKHRV